MNGFSAFRFLPVPGCANDWATAKLSLSGLRRRLKQLDMAAGSAASPGLSTVKDVVDLTATGNVTTLACSRPLSAAFDYWRHVA